MCINNENVYPNVYPIFYFIAYIYNIEKLLQWQAYQSFTEKTN